MTSFPASPGRRAVAAILAVFAAALLPSLVIGGLIAGLSLGQEVATAGLAAALMFVLAFAHAVAVLLPMGLILLSSGRLRWVWFALVGAGLGAGHGHLCLARRLWRRSDEPAVLCGQLRLGQLCLLGTGGGRIRPDGRTGVPCRVPGRAGRCRGAIAGRAAAHRLNGLQHPAAAT